jgi:hypothetical protein
VVDINDPVSKIRSLIAKKFQLDDIDNYTLEVGKKGNNEDIMD